jgi:hypothetical protein
MLREAGFKVEIHDNHFPPAAPDDQWLAAVSQRGWVVLTKDKRLRYNFPELLAITKNNARVYTLVSGNMTAFQMAEIFVKAAFHIEKTVELQQPPYIAKVFSSGSVKLWVDRKELLRQFRIK